MAGVVKVILNGTTLIDHSDSTIDPTKVLSSYVGYEGDGDRIVGTATGGGTGAVAVVDVPDSHGGIEKQITAVDISDTTATAADVASGEVFYTSNGTRTVGIGNNSGYWERPTGWPELSKLDRTGEVLYLSYRADEETGFCNFMCKTVSGQYTVELGHIEGNSFITENTWNFNSNVWCQRYFGSSQGGYKVLRITGTITYFQGADAQSVIQIEENMSRFGWATGLLEAYGRLPHLNSTFSFRVARYLQSVDVKDIAPTTLANSFYLCENLVSIDTSTWTMTNCTTIAEAFRNALSLKYIIGYENWDTKNITNMSRTFNGCRLIESFNLSAWNVEKVTNMSYLFSDCSALKEINNTGWKTNVLTNTERFVAGCVSLLNTDFTENLKMSLVTNTTYMFEACYVPTSITMPLDTTNTISANTFNGCRNVHEWHFLGTTPPTLANTNAFGNMTDFGGKKIYVPSSALSAYQTASNWSTYASYMVGE